MFIPCAELEGTHKDPQNLEQEEVTPVSSNQASLHIRDLEHLVWVWRSRTDGLMFSTISPDERCLLRRTTGTRLCVQGCRAAAKGRSTQHPQERATVHQGL